MPAFPTGATIKVSNKPALMSFVCSDGKIYSSRPKIPTTNGATVAQIRAAVDALANRSNGGMIRWSGGGVTEEIALSDIERIDDTHQGKTRAVFEFASDAGDTWSVRIPAPRAREFVGGAWSESPLITTANFADVEAFLETDGASWAFQRAYILGIKGLNSRASGAELDESNP